MLVPTLERLSGGTSRGPTPSVRGEEPNVRTSSLCTGAEGLGLPRHKAHPEEGPEGARHLPWSVLPEQAKSGTHLYDSG